MKHHGHSIFSEFTDLIRPNQSPVKEVFAIRQNQNNLNTRIVPSYLHQEDETFDFVANNRQVDQGELLQEQEISRVPQEMFRRSAIQLSVVSRKEEFIKNVEVFFRCKSMTYYSDQLSRNLSKKPSVYQVLFKNLGRKEFSPRLCLFQFSSRGIKQKDISFTEPKNLEINNFYKANSETLQKFGWGNKSYEFQFLKENDKSRLYIVDSLDNVVFESKNLKISSKRTKIETNFWKYKDRQQKEKIKKMFASKKKRIPPIYESNTSESITGGKRKRSNIHY